MSVFAFSLQVSIYSKNEVFIRIDGYIVLCVCEILISEKAVRQND